MGVWTRGHFFSCVHSFEGRFNNDAFCVVKKVFAFCVDFERAMENLDKLETLSENSDSDYIIMSNVSREPPVLEPEESPSLFNLLMELIWTYLCALCR